MKSSTIVSTGQSSGPQPLREFGDVGRRLTNTIQRHEKNLIEELGGVLNSSSPLMNVPKSIQAQLKRWDANVRTPEEMQEIKEVKSKIIEMYNENSDYIKSITKKNIDKIQLDLAVKTISKIMNGIHQILSSQ